MKLLTVILIISTSLSAFAKSDKELSDELKAWNATAEKVGCEIKVDQCVIALGSVARRMEEKSQMIWILTPIAVALSAGIGALVDTNNPWQGALVGAIGGWAGARLLTFEF